MARPTQELKEQFLNNKNLYDSLSQAVKIAKENGCTDKQIKPLLMRKQQIKKEMASDTKAVLRAMSLSNNIMQLDDNWYAIRYLNERYDLCIKVDALISSDVYMLKRDGLHERELSRKDLDTLLPGMLDYDVLEVHKQKLVSNAHDLIKVHVNIETKPTNEQAMEPLEEPTEQTIVVSEHAGKRWVQRVYGIVSEEGAEKYRKEHLEEVNSAVLAGFNSAEKVWEDTEEQITYWLDNDNIMYVKGILYGIPKIVTLYEELFGFSKDINRMITLQQLQVLASVKEELKQVEQRASEVTGAIEQEVQGINDQIAVLESQVAVLTAQRSAAIANKDTAIKEVKAVRDKYTAEFNKLFKKWGN